MKLELEIVTKEWAKTNGYKSITWPYFVTADAERELAERMDAQLAGTTSVWVAVAEGILEAYRSAAEMTARANDAGLYKPDKYRTKMADYFDVLP